MVENRVIVDGQSIDRLVLMVRSMVNNKQEELKALPSSLVLLLVGKHWPYSKRSSHKRLKWPF